MPDHFAKFEIIDTLSSRMLKLFEPAFGQHYGPGDTVGCGLEMDAKEIFFTRNGVRIGRCSDAGPASFLQFLPSPAIRSLTSSLNPTYHLCDLSDQPLTHCGKFVDDHTFGDFRGRVFPVLGLKDKGQLRTNFGTESSRPFKWTSAQDERVRKTNDTNQT